MPPPAFLGFGLLAPLRRDRKQDFANDGGEALIRSCVSQVLGTQCAGTDAVSTETQGELPWRSAFGSLTYRLKHKKGAMLQELGRTYVVNALRRWEPRVVIVRTNITFSESTRTLTIELVYDVIDRNVGGNNVLLSNVQQTLELPLAA